MRGVEILGQPRTEEFYQNLADLAAKVICKEFVPNDAKAQEIEDQVEKQSKKE